VSSGPITFQLGIYSPTASEFEIPLLRFKLPKPWSEFGLEQLTATLRWEEFPKRRSLGTLI